MNTINLKSLIFSLAIVLAGCGNEEREQAFNEIYTQLVPAAALRVDAPVSKEPIRPLPAIDPDILREPLVRLGRTLFHDTRLSGDNTISCASCHAIDAGGDDGLATSIGFQHRIGPINAPTVFNSGLNFRQFWDGRAATLTDQASRPVSADIEMGADWETVVETLSADKELVKKFGNAFGSDEVTQQRIVQAIARFEETLITPSPFDKYLLGQKNAISDDAIEGYQKFKAYGCSSCHQGINVGGNLYQQFGVFQQLDMQSFLESGSKPEVRARNHNVTLVKVPSLRNIELTAPYFHTGQINDLYTAVRIMGISQIGKDIPEEDINLIVTFLKSLTGDWQQHAELIEK